MSNSGKEDQESYSGRGTKKEQRVYIKIECLKGNIVPIITASIVVQWFKQFQDGRRFRSYVHYYWQDFDYNHVHITWQTNYGVWDSTGVRNAKNNDTLYFNQISDGRKRLWFWWVLHILFPTQNNIIRNCVIKIWLFTKRGNCIFAKNNRYRWNLGVWPQK